MSDISAVLKDRAVFFGWVAGLVLIAALIWSLSFPLRSACLMQAVNKTFALMNDERRLSASLPRSAAAPVPFGCWYRLSESSSAYAEGSLFLVFTIMKDGILVPCGAEISEKGKVLEIMPLGSHAQQVMEQIPPGLIQVYIRRIESTAIDIAANAAKGEGV